MKDNIKPCPACGGDADIQDMRTFGPYWLACTQCGMCGPGHDTDIKAVAAWNTLPRRLQRLPGPPTEPGWYWWISNSVEDWVISRFSFRNGELGVWFVEGYDEDSKFIWENEVYLDSIKFHCGPIKHPV